MKPVSFDYHRAASVDEAIRLLAELGDDAQILAGGQSLVPMMNMRLARPAHLVDINPIPDLGTIERRNGVIEIGALARHHDLVTSKVLAEECPILVEAAARIGHFAIRQRGTLGGSLSLADPAAELPMMARLLDAEIELQSVGGTRSLLASDYFEGIFTTARRPEEMLTRVRFVCLAPDEGWAFHSLARRPGDFFLVAAAATLKLDEEGRLAGVRLALGGVGPTPFVPTALVEAQLGRVPDGRWVSEVAAEMAKVVEPEDSPHASAVFKRELAAVLTRRALIDASMRASRRKPS